jgi:hypothetical protein
VKDDALIDLDADLAKDNIELPSSPIQMTKKHDNAVAAPHPAHTINASITGAVPLTVTVHGADFETSTETVAAPNAPKETKKERRRREHLERTALKKLQKANIQADDQLVGHQDEVLAQPILPAPSETTNLCAPDTGVVVELPKSSRMSPTTCDIAPQLAHPNSDERSKTVVEDSDTEARPPEDPKSDAALEESLVAGWVGSDLLPLDLNQF